MTMEDSFSTWFFAKIDSLPLYYPEKDSWNEEILSRFQKRFQLNENKKRNYRLKVWEFSLTEKKDHARIRVWVDSKGRSHLSVVVEEVEEYWYKNFVSPVSSRKVLKYYTSNPLDFIEEIERRYVINNNAKKFGL